MKMSVHILEFLQKYGKAEVPEFGTFHTENAPAKMDPESKIILPPAKNISYSPDYEISGEKLIQYISEKENIDSAKVQEELKTLTSFWKKTISEKDTLTVEELGIFSNNGDSVHFKGNRISSDAPDFYGLEEINLSDIRKKTAQQNAEYNFSKSFLWTAVATIAIAAIAYFGYTNQEQLFGKKMTDLSKKNAAEDSATFIQQKDSTSLAPVTDTIKIDSISAEQNLPAGNLQ